MHSKVGRRSSERDDKPDVGIPRVRASTGNEISLRRRAFSARSVSMGACTSVEDGEDKDETANVMDVINKGGNQ